MIEGNKKTIFNFPKKTKFELLRQSKKSSMQKKTACHVNQRNHPASYNQSIHFRALLKVGKWHVDVY